MNKHLVDFFQTPSGNVYAYNALTNEILTLEGIQENGCLTSTFCDDAYASLQKNGYVKQTGFSSIDWENSLDEFVQKNEDRIPTLILEMTRRCNLNCLYCSVSGASGDYSIKQKDISAGTVFQSIDFFAAHNKNCQTADISFYGGEALLKFDLIQKAVDYAEKKIQGKPLLFDISTNGLLLTKKVFAWLAYHPNVMITCTINGTFHDLYRKTHSGEGSLKIILQNLQYLRIHYPEVWEKQVKLLANIEKESDIFELLYFYREKIGKAPILVTFVEWGDRPSTRLQAKSDEAPFSLDKIDFRKSNIITDYYKRALIPINEREVDPDAVSAVIGSCFPCSVKLIVQTDGTFSYCERFCDRTIIGSIDDGFHIDKLKEIYEDGKALYNGKCKYCWAQRFCQICLSRVTNRKGLIFRDIPEELCSETKSLVEKQFVLYCKLAEENPDLLNELKYR